MAHLDYEQLAHRYDEDRERFGVPRDDVVDELLATLPAVRVLDLGCGTGTWLTEQHGLFAGRRVTWLGADPSAAMIAQARVKGVVNILRARAEQLPLRDGGCDYIVSSFSFHQFTDKRRALDEVSRILDPAHGVFRMNNIEPEAATGWWVYEFFPEAIAIDAARFWATARIVDALEETGFEVHAEHASTTEELPARNALADAERRVVSELALLDDEAYTRGVARLRRAASTPDATIITSQSLLRLTARRIV